MAKYSIQAVIFGLLFLIFICLNVIVTPLLYDSLNPISSALLPVTDSRSRCPGVSSVPIESGLFQFGFGICAPGFGASPCAAGPGARQQISGDREVRLLIAISAPVSPPLTQTMA